MSDRSSVARTGDGLVRIRTPEGQEIILTPERALEWISCRDFIDQLRFAAICAAICPALVRLVDKESGGD